MSSVRSEQHSVYSTVFTAQCLLHSVYSTVFTTQCLQHSVYNTVFTVQCLLHTVYSTVFTAQCLQHSVYCTVFTARCLLHSVYSTVFTVQCLLHSVYGTVFTAQCLRHGVYCTVFTAQCLLYNVYCTVFPGSDAGLWSPLIAHRTSKTNGCCGKSIIYSLLRVPWGPFAVPNAKRTTVLQISGTNSSCSTPSTVCMSVVPKVLCALSSGEIAFEEKTLNGLSLRAAQRLSVMLAVIGLGFVCVCVCVCVCVKGQQSVKVLGNKQKKRNVEPE